MLSHVMRILLDGKENVHSHTLIYRKNLLCCFVTKREELCGNNLTVNNILGLLHLGEDLYLYEKHFVVQLPKLFVRA